jgi:hypothetical protein
LRSVMLTVRDCPLPDGTAGVSGCQGRLCNLEPVTDR